MADQKEGKLEETLLADLGAIFKVPVTFDSPGESEEQKKLFVEVGDAQGFVKKGVEHYRVTGNATLYATNEQLRFGFFRKAIQEADDAITRKFFFHDLEENTRRIQNKVQRSFSFIYFFNGQYDPDAGSITEVTFDSPEEPIT